MLAVILIVAAALRLVALETVPHDIHVDETGGGLFALSILRGEGPHPFGTGFLGEPAMFEYGMAAFVRVLGREMMALRLVGAVGGLLSVAALYAFARVLFGRQTAILAAILLVGCASHLHFSRLALGLLIVPFFACLSLLALWRGVTDERAHWWLLSGMAAAAGAYFHFSAQITPVIVASAMAYLLVRQPGRWRVWLLHVGLLTVGATMTIAPKLLYLTWRGQKLTEHGESRLIFNQWDRVASVHGTSDPLLVLWGQLKLNLLGFLSRGDASSFYTFAGAPLLNGLTAILFLAGLVALLARIRDVRCAIVLCWFWVSLVVGGVLTTDPPQAQRLVQVVPAATLIAAMAIMALVDLTIRLGRLSDRRIVFGAGVVVALTASVTDANAYFGTYTNVHPYPAPTAQARFIQQLDRSYQVFVVASPLFDGNHPNFRFLTADRGVVELMNPSVTLPAAPLSRPTAFLVFQPRHDILPLLQSMYPGGELRPIEHPPGQVLTTAYLAPAGAGVLLAETQGLAGEVWPRSSAAPTSRRFDRLIAFRDLSSVVPDTSRPFRAVWRGRLVVSRPGLYAFDIFTEGGAILRLAGASLFQSPASDGTPRSLTHTVALETGQHPIEIEYEWHRHPGVFELRWQPPGEERSYVPPTALLAP